MRPRLCLEVPDSLDPGPWRARLGLGRAAARHAAAVEPVAILGTTVCFEAEVPSSGTGELLELCGRVEDGFSGRAFALPCRELRHRAPAPDYDALVEAFFAIYGAPWDLARRLDALDRLARRAAGEGYPFFSLQCSLQAVDECLLTGSEDILEQARRRLGELPPWLDQRAAVGLAGQVAYQRATLDLAGWRPRDAWEHLRDADHLYRRTAHQNHFLPALKQAEILARGGAVRDAVEHLKAALARCDEAPCDPFLLPDAHGQLAWLILLGQDATAAELAEADRALARALAGSSAAEDDRERANYLINLAYLRLRQGRDPLPGLAEARALLAVQPAGDARTRLLTAWADLIEGLAALAGGRAERALALCRRAAAPEFPRLAAWALSCAGEARRHQGRLEEAAEAFARALLLHEYAGPQRVGQNLPLGADQQADDYYRAARVAVERGRPGEAWELLARLDRRAAAEQARRRCRETVRSPAEQERWRRLERRRDALLERLLSLEEPTYPARRRQLEPVRRRIREELQELARGWPGCAEDPAAAPATTGLRAVPLEDEVLLLHRDAAGRATLAGRAPLARREVRRRAEAIAAALESGALDDATWRDLLTPLAGALVPRDLGLLGEVTPFALHGWLQGVPLTALPLPESSGRHWLGELTLPVLRPAAGARLSAAPGTVDGRALFVVDPRGDLPSGGEMLALYRRLYPRARVLHGAGATAAALDTALAGAALLHMDVHGLYDPAFPELSSLALADGPLSFLELAELPPPARLANLSGCQTGRWPITADAGRYGLAGLFAARGTAWVVASRTDLDDRLARDFNRAFYQDLAAGAPIPDAFTRALAAVRPTRPAAAWAALFLLQGG